MGSPEEKGGAQTLSKRIDKVMDWINESVRINLNTSIGESFKIKPRALLDKITELNLEIAELKKIGHKQKPGITVPVGEGDSEQEWKSMSGVDVFDQMYGIPSDEDQDQMIDRGDMDDDL
jgi:hypothetical protein